MIIKLFLEARNGRSRERVGETARKQQCSQQRESHCISSTDETWK